MNSTAVQAKVQSIKQSITEFLVTGIYMHTNLSTDTIIEELNSRLIRNNNRLVSKLFIRSRNAVRSISGNQWGFVSLEQLFSWTNEWSKTIPRNFDIVIGIPRSGLLVAGIIATKMGKPLSTPDLFAQGHAWPEQTGLSTNGLKKILLIDDTLCTGKSMKKSLETLRSNNPALEITKAVLITTDKSKHSVDLFFKAVPKLGLCEWNFLDKNPGRLGSDLDGVLCENCTKEIDSDEKLYVNWIRNAKPFLIPNFEIEVIVSSRLEKHRLDTEKWLSQNNVRYKELVLWNIESKKDREGKRGKRKVEEYLKRKPDVIWESSNAEAVEIRNGTKIPTLCTDTMTFLD